jgi:hypothetical protein
METNENQDQQQRDYTQQGEAENQHANYTSQPSEDGHDLEEKSDLQDTGGEEEEISGDLAGNASGNEDTDEQ